jgi:hypothetical protein
MASISLWDTAVSPDEVVHHGTSFVQCKKIVTETNAKGAKKFFMGPLKPNRGFLIFLLPPFGGPGA